MRHAMTANAARRLPRRPHSARQTRAPACLIALMALAACSAPGYDPSASERAACQNLARIAPCSAVDGEIACEMYMLAHRPSIDCAAEYDAQLACLAMLPICPTAGDILCPAEWAALGRCASLHPRPDAGPLDDVGLDGGLDAASEDAGPAPIADAYLPFVDAWQDDAGPISRSIQCLSTTHVTIPDRPSIEPAVPTTIEFWIRPRGPGLITSVGDPASVARLVTQLVGADDGTLTFTTWIDPSGPFGRGFELVQTFGVTRSLVGAWHHIAFVIDGSPEGWLRVALLVDGELLASFMDVDGTPIANYERVATHSALQLCSLDADLDEVRIWRVARTQAEIQANMRVTLPAGDPDLAAYYTFDEAGQVVLDSSGHGAIGLLGDTAGVEVSDPVRISENAF